MAPDGIERRGARRVGQPLPAARAAPAASGPAAREEARSAIDAAPDRSYVAASVHRRAPAPRPLGCPDLLCPDAAIVDPIPSTLPAEFPRLPASVGRVLLVRHGEGRGRIDGYMDRPLAFLREHAPALRSRIRVHETGEGPPPELAGIRGVVFFLADPLEELYPRCYREAMAIAERARERDLPVLNGPERLSNTRKGRQARLWREAGLPTPPGRRVRRRRELLAAADDFGLPLLLRSEIDHATRGLRLLETEEELEAYDPAGAWMVASPLVDARATYRGTEPAGWQERTLHPELWRRYHHKKRAYVVGERVIPFHLFFSEHPVVSLASSLYGPWRGWLLGAGHIPWPLSGLALRDERIVAAIEEEKQFFRRGLAAGTEQLLRRAATTLGLDYAALDYATRADGTVVLWEANAHPANLTKAHVPLRRERNAGARIERLYRAVAALFRSLLTDAPARPRGSGTDGADVEDGDRAAR